MSKIRCVSYAQIQSQNLCKSVKYPVVGFLQGFNFRDPTKTINSAIVFSTIQILWEASLNTKIKPRENYLSEY